MGGNGVKKHQKRLNNPSRYLLHKTKGVFSLKTNPGPHAARVSMPLGNIISHTLKYALNGTEVKKIVKAGMIKVDGKVRTDYKFPVSIMDVVSIEKTGEHFRCFYDTKGRFKFLRQHADEARYKLLHVKKIGHAKNNVPYIVTHDGRTIRYPNPDIKVGDTVEFQIMAKNDRDEESNYKVTNWIKMDTGNLCIITGGHNIGRIGTTQGATKKAGSATMVKVKDSAGHAFNTKKENIFIIGKGTKTMVSLPADKGIKKTITEERNARLEKMAQ